ncbi:carboxylesterase family protein [Sphingomonas sp. CGMCC 1.13654]|uniref:Carboxylic ester hydrolase n=1 Tax=Sphingomonas chungangi TaxID=2683589 RepID=A0A838L201_9SPHN|nr:carboxylesterase family protein [Sphingomonas chungangi]MBA2933523.1 carboxylesterase family protein [Sphingomonas chungangi]MVW54856.1 carboxylesterase family protein [Sphingomonas chungangi]
MTFRPANDRATPDDVVRVTLADGVVEGVERNGVRCFYSIPYAAPLTDERRFREPQPVEPWEGVRDATRPGPCPPQILPPSPPNIDLSAVSVPQLPDGPDYLTLNVFSAADRQAKRPVMLYIYGGGFVGGSKDVPAFDGVPLARDGVVCVVINYRVGIEGFLPLPGVPTNLGLRDMVAALQWTRDNIALFGGDPGNVTLFGHSGGACCIAVLLHSPLAKGLFHRAICHSGHGVVTRDRATMQKLVRRLARRLKVPATREGFLGVPRDRLLGAQSWVLKPSLLFDMRDRSGRDPSFGLTRFMPVHGDDVLPLETMEALRRGVGAEIDLLIGSTAQEVNAFFLLGNFFEKVRRWQAVLLVHKAMPRARAALRAYGLGRPGTKTGAVLMPALNDLMFRWMARRTAELHAGQAHVFEFEWRSPALGGKVGAAHGVDLPFVFGTVEMASGPDAMLGPNPPVELSDQLRTMWTGFARDGILPWPAYDTETRMVFACAAMSAAHEPVMPAAMFLP